ncbi:hypothetical protein B0A48_03454 [Cryoendolithus antarcticus]|uniref:RNA-directed DNA polymerase n=1 Tax=Cryoendolithus antarcticus TaxID=1507870 RepID=A0A1V8TK25_9PEZI|nr:hypothetical protein B0A48_03454 [Cryoendolithus antarcticus]
MSARTQAPESPANDDTEGIFTIKEQQLINSSSSYLNDRLERIAPREQAASNLPRSRSTFNLPIMEPAPQVTASQMEVFIGAPHQDAKRWWARLVANLQRDGVTEPRAKLDQFNSFLGDKPAEWAEDDHLVKRLLDEENDEVREADVKTVKDAFIADWGKKPRAAPNAIPEIQTLKQKSDETLRQYYNRAMNLLRSAGGDDNTATASQASKSILSLATTAYKRGIFDEELRLRVMRMAEPDDGNVRTLQNTYEKAESMERLIRDEHAMIGESRKEKELEVLKAYVMDRSMNRQPSAAIMEQVALITGVPFARQEVAGPSQHHQSFQMTGATEPMTFGPQKPTVTFADRARVYPAAPAPAPQQGGDATSMDPRSVAASIVRAHYPAFDPVQSANGYVNGTVIYRYRPDTPLCVKCGNLGHMSRDCNQRELPDEDQTFLWELIKHQKIKNIAVRDARVAATGSTAASANSILVDVGGRTAGHAKSRITTVETDDDDDDDEGDSDASDDELTGWEVAVRSGTATNDPRSQTMDIDSDEAREEARRKRQREEPVEFIVRCVEHQGKGDTDCDQGKCNHVCCQAPARRKLTPKKAGVGKQKKPLKPITAMLTEGPVNVRELLKTATIVLPISHLAQISPYFRDETKRMLSMPRQPRKKKAAAATTLTTETHAVEALALKKARYAKGKHISLELLNNIQQWRKRDRKTRAFTLPASVWTGDEKDAHSPPRNTVIADQGSDINLVYPSLQKKLGLKLRPVKQLNIPFIRMTVADGKTCELTHWASFQVRVQGIKRSVWALACPTDSRDIALLLGIPYLDSVDAQIRVRSTMIEIGDKARGEKIVKVQAKDCKPVAPKVEPVESSGDSTDEDDSEDEYEYEEYECEYEDEEEEGTNKEDSGDDDGSEETETTADFPKEETQGSHEAQVWHIDTLQATGGEYNEDQDLSFEVESLHVRVDDIATPTSRTNDHGGTAASTYTTARKLPDRPVIRRSLDTTQTLPALERWATEKGLVLGPLVPAEDRLEVLQTFWTYRDVESTGLETLGPPTDLITHRTRVKPGTPIYKARAKVMAREKEWWYRKFAMDGLQSGMYERTVYANGQLSQWGADPVLVKKEGKDMPRLTFNYHYVWEEPPGNQMQLSREAHAFLSLPSHHCFSSLDLKNGYWAVEIHPDDRHFLAFSVPGVGQLQPTWMAQGARSSSFTFNELGNIAFGALPGEPSFLHDERGREHPQHMTFYIDDIFPAHTTWKDHWHFIRQHLLPRLLWARLRLSFSKVKIGLGEVVALGELHMAGGRVAPKPERVRVLLDWPECQNPSDIRSFLGTSVSTRPWIKNYTELARPLQRLVQLKVDWRWEEAEQLSFITIKNLAATTALMFGFDPAHGVEMFVDASGSGGGAFIRQLQNGRMVPIAYDAFAFTPTEQNYDTYKRELKAMVTFAEKHSHMLMGPTKSIIWTDHKPLTTFLTSDNHGDIFYRFLERLRPLNIEIRHIEGKRNTAADGLSRTIFPPDCAPTPQVTALLEEARKHDVEGQREWFWKSGKGGYQEALKKAAETLQTNKSTTAAGTHDKEQDTGEAPLTTTENVNSVRVVVWCAKCEVRMRDQECPECGLLVGSRAHELEVDDKQPLGHGRRSTSTTTRPVIDGKEAEALAVRADRKRRKIASETTNTDDSEDEEHNTFTRDSAKRELEEGGDSESEGATGSKAHGSEGSDYEPDDHGEHHSESSGLSEHDESSELGGALRSEAQGKATGSTADDDSAAASEPVAQVSGSASKLPLVPEHLHCDGPECSTKFPYGIGKFTASLGLCKSCINRYKSNFGQHPPRRYRLPTKSKPRLGKEVTNLLPLAPSGKPKCDTLECHTPRPYPKGTFRPSAGLCSRCYNNYRLHHGNAPPQKYRLPYGHKVAMTSGLDLLNREEASSDEEAHAVAPTWVNPPTKPRTKDVITQQMPLRVERLEKTHRELMTALQKPGGPDEESMRELMDTYINTMRGGLDVRSKVYSGHRVRRDRRKRRIEEELEFGGLIDRDMEDQDDAMIPDAEDFWPYPLPTEQPRPRTEASEEMESRGPATELSPQNTEKVAPEPQRAFDETMLDPRLRTQPPALEIDPHMSLELAQGPTMLGLHELPRPSPYTGEVPSMVDDSKTLASAAPPSEFSAFNVETFSVEAAMTEDDWRALEDEWYADLIAYHRKGVKPKGWTKGRLRNFEKYAKPYKFSTTQNQLQRRVEDKWLPCVPPKDVPKVLQATHDKNGHFNEEIVQKKLQLRVFWPTMLKDIRDYTRSCVNCTIWADRKRSEGLITLDCVHPWEMLQADLMGPFPKSNRGNVFQLVITCCFSGFTIVRHLPDKAGPRVQEAFEDIFDTFTDPVVMYSDNGQEFVNLVFQAAAKARGIHLQPAPADSHRATGAVEGINRILRRCLEKVSPYYKNQRGEIFVDFGDWDIASKQCARAANERHMMKLHTSPSEVIMGYLPDQLRDMELAYPTDHRREVQALAVQYLPKDLPTDDLPGAYMRLNESRMEARQQLQEDRRKDKESRTRKYNAGVQREGVRVGDSVYVYATGNVSNYKSSWKGPYIVAEEVGEHGKSFLLRQEDQQTKILLLEEYLGSMGRYVSVAVDVCGLGYGVYIFFATMLILASIYAFFFIHETKGLRMDQMDGVFGLKRPEYAYDEGVP